MARFITKKKLKANFDHIDDDIKALQSVLSFARAESVDAKFVIVDSKWPVYKAIQHVFNCWSLKSYLHDNGITVTHNGFDESNNEEYELTFDRI